MRLKKLISFDIDGVLDVAGEPGPITLEMVKRARDLGYVIGSCSDIPVPMQRLMWEKHGVEVDFMVLKHNMGELPSQFQADECYLISRRDTGDYSLKTGFIFLPVDTTTDEPWMMDDASGSSS